MNATSENRFSKVTPPRLLAMKARQERITALTAYDYPLARLLDEAGIDVLLVGDSLGMSRLGYSSTIPVTLEEIFIHVQAVRRAVQRALLVADMPFGSYHVSAKQGLRNALRLVKDGGAEAIKIEGGSKRAKLVNRLVDAEIPVMGHIGLTPQSIYVFGGYKVQGKTAASAAQIREDALQLQEAGAFALVLEGIPGELARDVTGSLTIPTIGIGAGVHCDGQILVTDDLLGISFLPKPKFVRQYANLKEAISAAVGKYREDCLSGTFPSEEESYHVDSGVRSEAFGRKV
jgi:3-methyl-2-oxobutanoate hydroxymethyltransferase